MTIHVAFIEIIPSVTYSKNLKSTKCCTCRYHSASHFITDTRSKTKANSIVTLNHHWRDSSPTNAMIVISDDTDSDTQTLNTLEVDTTADNSLMSPWKNEMELGSDFISNDTEEDSIRVLPRTPVRPIIKKKSMTTSQIARKNSINKGTPVIERSIQRSNQSQRVKGSIINKKKTQKYHWSGTFRVKTSPKDTHCNTYYSPRKDKLHDVKNQLTNYNYYYEDFAKIKSASKEDIFNPNKFDPQTIDDSWEKWTDSNVSCQSYRSIDICVNDFERCNNFKDYDIDQDNCAMPAAFSNVNILKRRNMTDISDKNKNTHDIDSRIDNSIISYSQLKHDISNVNKENSNFCTAKELVKRSTNVKSNIRKTINDKKTSAIKLDCYKIWYSLLSFLQNVILFLLLPAVYIIFFIYVQKKEDKKQDNI